MSSFNEVSGQPVTSSHYLLTDILRGELGFTGYVVSDDESIKQLIRQGVACHQQRLMPPVNAVKVSDGHRGGTLCINGKCFECFHPGKSNLSKMNLPAVKTV